MPICTGDHSTMSTGTLWSADTFANDMIVNDESDLVGKQSGMMSRGEEHGKLSRQRFAKRARRLLFTFGNSSSKRNVSQFTVP